MGTMCRLVRAFRCKVHLSFFTEEEFQLYNARELYAPILCAFKDGSYTVLPVDCVGQNVQVILGAKYNQLVSWSPLPIHSSIHHPGTAWNNTNLFVEGRYISQYLDRITDDDWYFDFYLLCLESQEHLDRFVSNLAFLWKKGYDTISSLVSGPRKFVESSDMNTLNLNDQNFHMVTSIITSTPIDKNSKEP